ncbi:radical SAM protein [Chloroflexota bacterium]
MNLVLARGCSNSCSYCFETAERQGGEKGFISMENVDKFADWVRKSRLGSLQLVGGEPFLHPKLGAIVTKFRQVCPGTSLMVLTGGVFNKHLLDSLSPEDVGIAFNINEPRDYKNPKHFTKVMNNVKTAIIKGFRVVIGFNVWRMDFDTDFMPNLAHSLARTHFRWAVANPVRDFPTSVVKPMHYSALAERCFAMLQEAARLNIEARLDCPLPLCFFTDSQLGWVRQYHPGTVQRMGCCSPALDVTPELEVIRCFALSKLVRVNLTEFPNEEEISAWFLARIEPQLLHRGCFSHCSECLHFKTGRCYGGCLAWHECDVDAEAEPSAFSLAIGMGEAIDAGKPDLALDQYERANYWSKAAMPTFEASVAAFRLDKWEQAFRYAAYAQDMTFDLTLKGEVSEVMKVIPQSNIEADSCSHLGESSPMFVSYPSREDGEAGGSNCE